MGGAWIGSVRGASTGRIRDPNDECDEVGFMMEINGWKSRRADWGRGGQEAPVECGGNIGRDVSWFGRRETCAHT
jgi:hypothetical protein